jgi:hypothetical protein
MWATVQLVAMWATVQLVAMWATVQSVAVSAKWARVWFAATAIAVVAGVIISVFTAAHNSGGHFRNGVQRGFIAFAFFTVQSNLVVGATSAMLAVLFLGLSASFTALDGHLSPMRRDVPQVAREPT